MKAGTGRRSWHAVVTTDPGSIDEPTVSGFGYQWTTFDQSAADPGETRRLFEKYFRIFPWTILPSDPVGFDLGSGSGRWASLVAERTSRVVCIDASGAALQVTRRNAPACPLVLAAAGALPIRPRSMDFGYSLGVLHHIPDPLSGLRDAVRTLKPGAPFLVFLYYTFDNRPQWFRAMWRGSDLVRRFVSRQPDWFRYAVSQVVAFTVYLPLARTAAFLERRGRNVETFPLSIYRECSLYVMRTDALDRLGTRLEHRFSKADVRKLLEDAGLERPIASDDPPYWCAVGFKPAEQGPVP